MDDELVKARNFARTVRFSEDTLTADESIKIENTEIDAFFSLNSIHITPLVTPVISKSIDKVIKRLQIPPSSIKAYVYASPEIQATCYAGNDVDCVIRLSSGLIDILENNELEFVIGHEIGHFLYSHGLAASLNNNNESLEFSIKQRAQEISADRIGLLASESLDASIRAMMKTISGLTTKYLKFNIAAFLSQLSNTAKYKSQISINSSHPSWLIRCRALLWFSMSETFKSGEKNYQPNEIDKLNAKIQSDIHKYIDSLAYEKIDDLKKDVEMWLAVSMIVEDGSFNSDEQVVFKEMFGQNSLEKLKTFLSSHDSATAAKKSVSKKLEDSRKILRSTIPMSFKSEMELLEKKIKTNFS